MMNCVEKEGILREYHELSQKGKFLSERYCPVSYKNWLCIDIIVVITLRVCWSSLTTASLRQLEDVLLLDINIKNRLPQDVSRKQHTLQ